MWMYTLYLFICIIIIVITVWAYISAVSVLVSVRVLFYIIIIMYYVRRCETREKIIHFRLIFFQGGRTYIHGICVYNTIVIIPCTFLPIQLQWWRRSVGFTKNNHIYLILNASLIFIYRYIMFLLLFVFPTMCP